MKLSVFLFFVALWQLMVPVLGQTSDSKTGVVISTLPQTKSSSQVDLTKVDFKNFTFPDPAGGKAETTFTLKNGQSADKRFSLLKTYFFELTRDDENEAVVMIAAQDCPVGCEERRLFYVFSADGERPKIIFKIAPGTAAMGGLKAVNFDVNEIVLELFGECNLNDWTVVPNAAKSKALKPTSYTRFVFSRSATDFIANGRDTLPMASVDLLEYRPKISFGKQP